MVFRLLRTESRRWSVGSLRTLTPALVAVALTLAACGGGDRGTSADGTTSTGVAGSAGPVEVLREPAAEVGPEPFTEVMGDGDFAAEVAALPASERDAGESTLHAGTAPGLYGGTGDVSRCDADALVEFLGENSDKAGAWAGTIGVPTGDIAKYVDTLEPRVLLHDTRVTNHGFSSGRATPRQSVLQAGTAVLVDGAGVPRTRCACGNPLAPPDVSEGEEIAGPSWPGDETPHIVLPGPVVPVPEVPLDSDPGAETDESSDDFCVVWAEVEPTVAGGPTGPDDVEAYVVKAQEGFSRLVEAAEQTPGFPTDALADLTQYRDDLLAWSGTGSPGSTEVRDRLESFLPTWCADRPEAGETDADESVPSITPEDPVPGTNCGSMQFFLLVYAAGELGVDHTDVSEPYADALDAVLAGVDPGPSFEVADMAPMLAYEEVGCQGAQAVYELLVEAGYEDVVAGTDLDPWQA